MNTETQGALKLAHVAETRWMLSAAAMVALLASVTGHASEVEKLVPIGVPENGNEAFEAPCHRGEVLVGLGVDTYGATLSVIPVCAKPSNLSVKTQIFGRARSQAACSESLTRLGSSSSGGVTFSASGVRGSQTCRMTRAPTAACAQRAQVASARPVSGGSQRRDVFDCMVIS